MKPTRIEWTPETREPFRILMDELLKESKTAEELILRVLSGDDPLSVTIFNDDAKRLEQDDVVCIEILEDIGEKVQIAVTLSELDHPEAPSIESFFRGYNERNRIIFDDRALDAWEESIGFQRYETLGNTIGHRSSLFPFIASFLKSGSAEVYLSRPFFFNFERHPDTEKAILKAGLIPERIVSIKAQYRAKEMGKGIIPGFGTDRCFHL